MDDYLKFKYKPIKNPKKSLVLQLVMSIVIIVGLLIIYEEDELFKFSFLFYYLPIVVIIELFKLYKYNKMINTYAVLITSDKIIYSTNFTELYWEDANKLSYKTKHIASYLLIDLKDSKTFIKNQKWYKRPKLRYNNWKFKTPLVINLERIEGETDMNYQKIKSFIEEHNLLSIN